MSLGILPENMKEDLRYDVEGTIFLENPTFNITFNMYWGKISNNQSINNSELYSNEN